MKTAADRNAMVGGGKTFGKSDDLIQQGMSAERYTCTCIVHSKNKVVTLTVIHVILVAFSQGLVTLPCSDMVCWLALCVLAHYAPLGEVP